MLIRLVTSVAVLGGWALCMGVVTSIANAKIPGSLALAFICFLLVTWGAAKLLKLLLYQPVLDLLNGILNREFPNSPKGNLTGGQKE